MKSVQSEAASLSADAATTGTLVSSSDMELVRLRCCDEMEPRAPPRSVDAHDDITSSLAPPSITASSPLLLMLALAGNRGNRRRSVHDISTATIQRRPTLHHRTNCRNNRSNPCEDIAIFVIFQYGGNGKRPDEDCTSPYKIRRCQVEMHLGRRSKSVKLPLCGACCIPVAWPGAGSRDRGTLALATTSSTWVISGVIVTDSAR